MENEAATTWQQVALAALTALVPLAWAVLAEFKARRAARQRDAVIKGVEEAGDHKTKRAIKVAASEAGVEHLMRKDVHRVTRRLEGGVNGSGPPVALLLLLVLVLALPGCCHDLQRPYVEAVEAIRLAVEADRAAGLYQPDAAGVATLDEWKRLQQTQADVLADGDGGDE